MMRIITSSRVALLFLGIGTCFGQTGTPALRLEDLERMALANNPTMGQAAARVRMAAGKSAQAGLYPNPTIFATGDEIAGLPSIPRPSTCGRLFPSVLCG